MKYLCLAWEDEETLNALTRSEWDALRRETLDYVAELEARGILLDARPLQSATLTTRVRVRDGQVNITDGPFPETKEQIGGFFLVEVDNLDQALRIAADWPSARIGTIEVRPLEEELPMNRRYRR